MKELNIASMENILLEYEIATIDELILVASINGYTKETMQNILYARTGRNDFYTFLEEIQELM